MDARVTSSCSKGSRPWRATVVLVAITVFASGCALLRHPIPGTSGRAQVVVGPLAWTPASDHPLVLASASAPGDASNVETVNGTISLQRLVRTDNNIATRAM